MPPKKDNGSKLAALLASNQAKRMVNSGKKMRKALASLTVPKPESSGQDGYASGAQSPVTSRGFLGTFATSNW